MNKMKTSHPPVRRRLALSLAFPLALAALNFFLTQTLPAQEASKDKPSADAPKGQAKPAAGATDLVPLNLKLPAPAFKGTPKDIQLSSYVEPLSEKPRPPMMVPPGLKNLAPTAKLTSSDKNCSEESLTKLKDGDKESSDQSIIFLRTG